MAKEVGAKETGAGCALRDLEVCGFGEKGQTSPVLGETPSKGGFYTAKK